MKNIDPFWGICAIACSLALMSTFFWYDGSDEEITVVGQNGTKYKNYQDCCAAEDFQAAHQFITKMENSYEYSSRDVKEAKKNVLKQEALYLMSLDNEQAKKRIIYLLKEEGASDEHIDLLIDLAIDAGDEDFVKALTKQYKEDISSNVLCKIVEFLYIEKGEENLDFVTKLLNRYNQRKILLDAAIKKGEMDIVLSLAELIDVRACDQALLTKLSRMSNNRVSDGIIGSVITLENRIPQRPSIGKVNAGYSNGNDEFREKNDEFISQVKKHNDVCRRVLNTAINTNNIYLAKKIIPQFKSNINYQRWDNPRDNFFWYIVSVDNNDINDAKKTYQEAVKSGAFK